MYDERCDALRANDRPTSYGFEALPGMLAALEADLDSYGPLVSDAATRDFLAECQARCDRLDEATLTFLKLCTDTEAKLEAA